MGVLLYRLRGGDRGSTLWNGLWRAGKSHSISSKPGVLAVNARGEQKGEGQKERRKKGKPAC